MQLEPFGDRVVIDVTRDTATERKVGSVFLPADVGEAERPETIGTIVAVGPLCKSGIEVGDQAMYATFSSIKIPGQGRDYLVMRESELVGRWRDADQADKTAAETMEELVDKVTA